MQAPRGGRARQADGDAARRDVPGRSGRHRHACSSRWGWRPVRSCRRANGASSMPRSTAPRSRAIHPFYTACVREFEAAGRTVVGSAPVGHDGTAAWLDAIGEACGVARDTDRRGQEQAAARDPRRARADADQRAHHAVGLRGLGAAGRAPAGRERRGRALCRHRLPAHALGPTPTANGSKPAACTSSTAPRSSRTSPRWRNSSRTSPSARRRSCRRPKRRRCRRSISPT